MKRILIPFILICAASTLTGFPQKNVKRKIACKTVKNAKTCYWTHGRLVEANGNPSYRLWKIGTHRILGIYSGSGAEHLDELDNEHPELPDNLNKYDLAKVELFGDFEICPLEPEKPGHMQAACIESAKNIVARQ